MSAPDWNALERIHDHFRDSAFAICAAGEEVTPQLFAVEADAEGRGLRLAAMPQLIGMLMGSEQGKAAFARMLPDLVRPGPMHDALIEAIGFTPTVFVQINEAWMARAEPGETGPNYVPASQRANRTEAILIALHFETHSIVAIHDIVDTPTRHAVARPFPRPDESEKFFGRFTMQEAIAERSTKH